MKRNDKKVASYFLGGIAGAYFGLVGLPIIIESTENKTGAYKIALGSAFLIIGVLSADAIYRFYEKRQNNLNS